MDKNKMLIVKRKIKEIASGVDEIKKTIRLFIIPVLITATFFAGLYFFGNKFTEFIWIINVTLLGIFLLVIMFLAGFVALKSLFFVAAELSLLIFLGQSYCATPSRIVSGNEALKSLLVIGILYILVNFYRSLKNGMKENYKFVENKKPSKEKTIFMALFCIFIILFIQQIYFVVSPIIFDLCIFK